MLKTLIYKFKKRELADSPPDITATEDNWDIVERELIQLNGFKIYKSLSDLGVTTPKSIVDIVKAMQDNSMIAFSDIDKVIEQPMVTWGQIVIIKTNIYRNSVSFYSQQFVGEEKRYYKQEGCVSGTNFTGWKNVATVEKISISLENGWVDAFTDSSSVTITKIGDMVFGNLTIKGGKFTNDTVILALPVGYRPPKRFAITCTGYTSSWGVHACTVDMITNGNVTCRELGANNRLNISLAFSIV